jgi:hypothetical protein
MASEIRIYVCDSEDWYCSTPNADIDMAMECAESQGTVYTLGEFIRQFNEGELTIDLSKNSVTLSCAEFEDGEFVKEIG